MYLFIVYIHFEINTYVTVLMIIALINIHFVTAQCIAPLGMESKQIKDEDITASSSFDHGNVGPHHGR